MNGFKNIPAFFVSLAHPNPERDWFIGLSVLSLPVVCFVLYAAYTFFGLQSGFIVNSNPAPFPAQTITEEEIDSVLDTYRARKARYEAGTEATVVPAVLPPAPRVGQ